MVEDGRVRGLPAGASSGVPGCLGLLPLLEVGGQAAATHLEVLLHARPEGSPELASGAVVVSHALVGVSNVVLDRLHRGRHVRLARSLVIGHALASGGVVVSHALVGVSNVVLDRLHHALASVAVYLRSGRRD